MKISTVGIMFQPNKLKRSKSESSMVHHTEINGDNILMIEKCLKTTNQKHRSELEKRGYFHPVFGLIFNSDYNLTCPLDWIPYKMGEWMYCNQNLHYVLNYDPFITDKILPPPPLIRSNNTIIEIATFNHKFESQFIVLLKARRYFVLRAMRERDLNNAIYVMTFLIKIKNNHQLGKSEVFKNILDMLSKNAITYSMMKEPSASSDVGSLSSLYYS